MYGIPCLCGYNRNRRYYTPTPKISITKKYSEDYINLVGSVQKRCTVRVPSCTLLLALFPGVDFETASSAAIASLGNIGPGLNKVGATCTYAWMNPFAKTLLTLAMLLGRLEVYTVLVVILPTFWKK